MYRHYIAVIAFCFLFSACEEISEEGLVVNVVGSSLSDSEKRLSEHALDGLEVAPGLEATLFASEPMLVNPTNIDVDERGRVWVCEGINYRPQLNPQNPERTEKERIVILEDTDDDGRADSRTVFYEGHDINAALGIFVMGNKAIVSASPNVLLLTDTDGDDRADEKEILFTAIGGEQHDHAVHAFVFGPDGRFYFNFGNEGKQLADKEGNVVVDKSGRPVVTDGNPYRQGMVFRMNSDGSDLEVLGHNFRNNYEVAIDSYGTLWQSDNDDDGNQAVRINYVMEYGNYGFRDEITGENWRARRTGMHEEIPKRHWHLNDPGVVPNLLQTGAGSPTGILVYEGRLLPEVFWDQMIHTDAGPNVVRAYPVTDAGAGYEAEMVNLMKGTNDQWFRPSDVTVAPDGSLIVADWYDPGVGGHHVGDLERGRIFRIAPRGSRYRSPSYELSTPDGAVAALQNPNLSHRYHAWMALEQMGSEAEPALLELWESMNPRFRARALWLLGRIEGRQNHYVEMAIADENPDIRITGLRLARQLELLIMPVLEKLVVDPSPQVRREVALALRDVESPRAPEMWTQLASQYDGQDRWYLEALGIAADGRWDSFFRAWRLHNAENWSSPAARDIVWRARSAGAIPMLADLILDESTTEKDRLRYFRAFDFHADEAAKADQLPRLLSVEHSAQPQIAVLALQHLVTGQLIENPGLNEPLYETLERVKGTRAYLDLVKRFELSDQSEQLFQMALESDSDELQRDASSLLIELGQGSLFRDAILETSGEVEASLIERLGEINSGGSREILRSLVTDSELALETRRRTLDAIGPGWQGENLILGMLEAGTFPDDLKGMAAGILFNSSDDRRRVRAAEYLDPPADMQGEPLPPIAELIEKNGDPAAGKTHFDQLCASCHVVNGQGTDFGPDLSQIGAKLPREALYNAILFPDAGIGFGYEGFVVHLKDGGAAMGYVLNRSDEEIQLREQGGQTRSYTLNDVDRIEAMDNSLMPALGRSMNEQQLVDMVAYLEELE